MGFRELALTLLASAIIGGLASAAFMPRVPASEAPETAAAAPQSSPAALAPATAAPSAPAPAMPAPAPEPEPDAVTAIPVPIPRPVLPPAEPERLDPKKHKVTLVRVSKAARKLELMSGDQVLRAYPMALGGNPLGHKQQQGDSRTPEGRYTLDWRNPNSLYYRSIHVSYPNAQDRKSARQRGVDPGGDIMIHAQPNSWPSASIGIPGDWTLGCIAVTNEHMDEIWAMVKDGTPIDITP